MRILLKQFQTGRFLKDRGRWTAESADALNFKTIPAAMDYSLIHGYQGTSIVLKFFDARDDLELTNCC